MLSISILCAPGVFKGGLLRPADVDARTADVSFKIQFEKGNILFAAKQVPLRHVLSELHREFRIRITGLEDRGTESVTYTIAAESLRDIIRGLMRHLAVKNYALEETDGNLTHVSVFPEARQIVSPEPPSSPSESIQSEDKEPNPSAGAAEVLSIVSGSQAEGLDIQKGDIILEYGGIKISRAAELVKESRKKPPDEEVELLVLRNGEQVRVNVKGGFIGVRIKSVNVPTEPGIVR